MDDNRLPKKKKLNYKPEGRRNIKDHKRDGKVISGREELIVDDEVKQRLEVH